MTRLLTKRPGGLIAAFVLAALTTLAGVGLMGASGWLIARAAEHPEASALTLAAVTVRALGLGRGVLRYGERLLGHDAVLRWVADMRVAVFERLRGQPSALRSGQALSALGRDVEGLQDLWLRGLVPWAAAATVAITSGLLAGLVLLEAGMVLSVGRALAVVGMPALAWRWAAEGEGLAEARSAHQTALADLLHGAADLVVNKGTAGALQETSRTSDELDDLSHLAARRAARLFAAVVLLQGLTTAGVVTVSAAAVQSGALDRVWVVVLALGAFASFEPVAGLVDAVYAVRVGRGAVHRLSELEGAASTDTLHEALSDYPEVHARDLTLLREGRVSPAVHGIDLDLVPGQAVALVGGSGAGKSTLLQLLAGQLEPTSGSVRVRGIPAHQLRQEERPLTVALVEQGAHVFDASLRDNLRLAAPGAADAELDRVLRLVGLESWQASLADGLDTQLGHRGARLSGGQRRRLCVARGLLSPAPILLLDEPTEGLAPDEADCLLDTVLSASAHRAVLFVTHRLSCLDKVDEVIVLERGEVVTSGAPALALRRSGLLRDAAALQTVRPPASAGLSR